MRKPKKHKRTRAENLHLIAECKRLVAELRRDRHRLPHGI